MTFDKFHNALRILMNIDKAQFMETLDPQDMEVFSAEQPDWAKEQWCVFANNPHRYFIQCCDSQAKALWKIIEERNAG